MDYYSAINILLSVSLFPSWVHFVLSLLLSLDFTLRKGRSLYRGLRNSEQTLMARCRLLFIFVHVTGKWQDVVLGFCMALARCTQMKIKIKVQSRLTLLWNSLHNSNCSLINSAFIKSNCHAKRHKCAY